MMMPNLTQKLSVKHHGMKTQTLTSPHLDVESAAMSGLLPRYDGVY